MVELTLKQFLNDRTQSAAAAILGVTQGAISQMLLSGRDIRIRTDEAGNVLETFEVKPIGGSVAEQAA